MLSVDALYVVDSVLFEEKVAMFNCDVFLSPLCLAFIFHRNVHCLL